MLVERFAVIADEEDDGAIPQARVAKALRELRYQLVHVVCSVHVAPEHDWRAIRRPGVHEVPLAGRRGLERLLTTRGNEVWVVSVLQIEPEKEGLAGMARSPVAGELE